MNRKKHFFLLRKAYMTLLETMIALSLLSILLVFVFGIFRELTELSQLTEKSRKESFQMRYVESRLGFIFERIVNENKNGRQFFFYTLPPVEEISRSTSLIFTFDNGVRLNPAFSGDVLGRLFVDLKGRLCLATWPLHVSESRELLEQEVLMDRVMSVEYSFYAAPEKVHDDKEIVSGETISPDEKIPAKNTWHENWAFTYEQMPSIMKIRVKVAKNNKDFKEGKRGVRIETDELIFHFVLPSSKNPVHYPPGALTS